MVTCPGLFRALFGLLLTIVCAQRVDDPVSPWSSSNGSTNSEVGRDDLAAVYALLQVAQAFATENPRLASYIVQLGSTIIGKQTLDNIGYDVALDETGTRLCVGGSRRFGRRLRSPTTCTGVARLLEPTPAGERYATHRGRGCDFQAWPNEHQHAVHVVHGACFLRPAVRRTFVMALLADTHEGWTDVHADGSARTYILCTGAASEAEATNTEAMIKMWSEKSPREAIEALGEDDIVVTNQSDKDQQLKILKNFAESAGGLYDQAVAESAMPLAFEIEQ